MRRFIDQERPLSLYVHVPFCSRKCSYCAFYSVPSSECGEKDMERYHEIVMRQIIGIREEFPHAFDTLYIGGGNPGMLGPERLASLLCEAEFPGMPKEVTVELNPEQVTKEMIRTIRPYVTRISIGIQSLDDDMLSSLGRNSTRKRNLEALSILRAEGIPYNADLIAAVPGFSASYSIRDIDELSTFDPCHISFYCLCYEEGTPMFARLAERDENLEIDCLRSGWNRLAELGYEHYEISNFAREGAYSLHNLAYWHLGQYIGLGPGAESSLGYAPTCSVRCNDDLRTFLSCPTLDFEPLDMTKTMLEYIMVSLRTKWGIDKVEFAQRFSIGFDETFSDSVSHLESNLYRDDPERFCLTEDGFMLLDSIIFSLYCAY